ncbi:MAG: class I SAM-dependent methyltransferase [Pseudomonadota bacterium]
MEQSHRTFAGSIPENYQRYLVPLIFEDYAADLAGRLEVQSGGAVLETACGTGVVTRHLLARLPQGGLVIATDFNPGMIVEAKARLGEAPGLSFQEADATDLPFDDGAFDALVCQFGVMFFPDKAKGYAEAARILKPGAPFLFNVWDSLAENRLSQLAHDTLGALFPEDPPSFLELPFGYQDMTAILRALQAAGFAHVDFSVQPRLSRAPGAQDVAAAFCRGSPLANYLAERGEESEAQALAALIQALEAAFGKGPIEAPMQAIQIRALKAG